ncbi:MAG TPA: glycosyltransferase [Ferruginibacter sp.]|nr:glycosyltransferase [Ferruginibacter sp.]
MEGVSVIICCYNSADRLKQTLAHLAKQRVDKEIKWEVIVVDNNSTDNTTAEAQRIWNSFQKDISFTIVQEPQAGLSFARHKGVKKSAFEFVIFCDDDNWLEEDYISIAYNFLRSNERYAAVGGQSTAVFEVGVTEPEWFQEYKSGYAVGQQAEEGDVTKKGYVWGAGIAFRRSLYYTVMNNLFPSLLTDRKGNELSSGGDCEICLRFIIIGYKIYNTNKLKLEHFISSNRLTIEYREKLGKGLDDAWGILGKYYFYIACRSSKKDRIKTIVKYWLSVFKLKDLNPTEKDMASIFTRYNDNENAPVFKLMNGLRKQKVV